MTLPRIMVAPNGAHRTKADHPALPVTIPEIVACAIDCHAAGADGIHAHVRDRDGAHILDAGLYRELLAELAHVVPDMLVQITTEAVGRYSPAEQRQLVRDVRPCAVSIALREIMSENNRAITQRFFHHCAENEIAVQHILYSADEVDLLHGLIAQGVISAHGLQLLHVLGRYTAGQRSDPCDMDAPLARHQSLGMSADWAVCAFGNLETACLVMASQRGGKVRIGFENNLFDSNDQVSASNSVRVRELISALARVA